MQYCCVEIQHDIITVSCPKSVITGFFFLLCESLSILWTIKDMCLDICFAALARPLVLGLVVDDVLFTPKVKR